MSTHFKNLFRLTIGKKLILVIATLLLVALLSLTHLASSLFKADTEALVQQMTTESSLHLAEMLRLEIENRIEKSKGAGFFMLQNPGVIESTRKAEPAEALAEIKEDSDKVVPLSAREMYVKQLQEKDSNLYGIFLFQSKADQPMELKDSLIFDPLLKLGEKDGSHFGHSLLSEPRLNFSKEMQSETQMTSIFAPDESPVIALMTPFFKDEKKQTNSILVTVFSQSAWVTHFSNASFTSNFMVDNDGGVIIHPDFSLVKVRYNFSKSGIVQKAMEGKQTNGQARYLDEETKENRMGAFSLLGIGKLAVVSEVSETKAFEAANRLQYRAFLMAFAVLFLACGIGYVFSKSLVHPIQKLVSATERIASGNFTARMHSKGSDEVAHLFTAFNKMAEGLEERDRVKAIFGKFHNKEVAEKLLSGQVKLGGEKKEAVIFFSDIRGFTTLSEQLAPEEVVVFLNEYMTQMVSVIRNHSGIVDKYVGDAIMALWGVPLTGTDDPGQAILACLEMRKGLARFNEAREAKGLSPIYMGMGLNLGTVVAGNIGSEEKMEYTVIGDSVNTASRIESMTKEFGTDLLISSSVAEKIADRFILDACEKVKVKGKAEDLVLYRVLGYKNAAGESILVETKYSSYPATKSEKSETTPKIAA